MLRSLLTKTIRDRRRAMAWWSGSVVLYMLVTASAFTSVRGQQDRLQDLIDSYPDALLVLFGIDKDVDLASAAGFLNSQIFGWLAPLVFLVFAMAFGARAIAGEEEAKTMDLLMANPVARKSAVIQLFGAMTLLVGALGAALFVGLWLGTVFVDMDIGVDRLAAGAFSAALLGVTFGALALALSAATGSRALTLGIGAGLAVSTYLLNSLAQLIDALDAVQKASPFFYYSANQPLQNGLHTGHVTVLVLSAAVFLGAAVTMFERRDLGV